MRKQLKNLVFQIHLNMEEILDGLMKKIYQKKFMKILNFLKTEEISKPIYLNDTIVIIKKTGKRVF